MIQKSLPLCSLLQNAYLRKYAFYDFESKFIKKFVFVFKFRPLQLRKTITLQQLRKN
jgi:hypothetical protein